MRAMVIRSFGPSTNFELADLPVPRCGPEELLIRVHAAGVNPVDWKMRTGHLWFLSGRRFPMTLGFDLAGVVEEVGREVPGFLSGDRVVASSDARTGRAYAEYAVVKADRAVHLPEAMTMAAAAAIPGSGCTALQALRDVADLKPGNSVMVVGASGGVGTFAVQIARAWAVRVTGVCSGHNVGLVRDLGAHRVIDYTSDEVWDDLQGYDVVFDAVAAHELADARSSLKPEGVFLSTLPTGRRIADSVWTRIRAGPRLKLVMVRPNGPDLCVLLDMVHQGKIRPVLDRVFSLEEVAAAHDLSETGHARGKIILQLVEPAPDGG